MKNVVLQRPILRLTALAAFMGVAAAAGYAGIHHYRDHERLRDTRLTVADKKDGVVTNSIGTRFVVEDAPQHKVFNAAATYAGMRVGCTYDVSIYGTRVHQMTGIPANIVSAQLVDTPQCPKAKTLTK